MVRKGIEKGNKERVIKNQKIKYRHSREGGNDKQSFYLIRESPFEKRVVIAGLTRNLYAFMQKHGVMARLATPCLHADCGS